MFKKDKITLFLIGSIVVIGLIVGIIVSIWMLISGITGAYQGWLNHNIKQFGWCLARAILFETGMLTFFPFYIISKIIAIF